MGVYKVKNREIIVNAWQFDGTNLDDFKALVSAGKQERQSSKFIGDQFKNFGEFNKTGLFTFKCDEDGKNGDYLVEFRVNGQNSYLANTKEEFETNFEPI